jgi:hypothetical protein
MALYRDAFLVVGVSAVSSELGRGRVYIALLERIRGLATSFGVQPALRGWDDSLMVAPKLANPVGAGWIFRSDPRP